MWWWLFLYKKYEKAGSPASNDVPDRTTIPTEKQKAKPAKKKGIKKVNGYKKNKWGILYKAEKGTFTCKATQGIVTRYTGPSIHNPVAGALEYNQSVNYDEVQDYEGYIWISWKVHSGKTVYMPIGKSDGKGNRVGAAWGTFS